MEGIGITKEMIVEWMKLSFSCSPEEKKLLLPSPPEGYDFCAELVEIWTKVDNLVRVPEFHVRHGGGGGPVTVLCFGLRRYAALWLVKRGGRQLPPHDATSGAPYPQQPPWVEDANELYRLLRRAVTYLFTLKPAQLLEQGLDELDGIIKHLCWWLACSE